MNHTKPLKIISVILISVFILTTAFNSIPLSKFINNQNYDENSFNPNLGIREILSSPYNTTFLPKTNLSVQEYVSGAPNNSYNITVLSIDNDFWTIHCDYYYPSVPQIFSFDSTVNRTSVDGLYEAINYYNWFNETQNVFDYWINESNFDIGNDFEGLTINSKETISMNGLGTFNVWKLSGYYGGLFPVTVRYEVSTGMFICTMIDFIGTIYWYNLTKVELGQIQSGYTGPILHNISPENDTKHPNGTTIYAEFESPYDVNTLYYQWDDNFNFSIRSASLEIPLPSDDGLHHLYITAIDSLTYANLYHFVFETDNDFPSISVNYQNNSRIQSSSQISISVINGNGTIFYSWDEDPRSSVEANITTISVPGEFEDGEQHVLNISVRSENITDLWSIKLLVFVIDDTPPIFTIYSPINRSVIKGTVNIRFAVSEISNVTYKLNNEFIDSIIVEAGINRTIPLPPLENGSYQLNFTVFDEAKNPTKAVLLIFIYSSAFGWNWDLDAEIPRTINVVDASETTWFYLSLISKTDQIFNLTVLPDELSPSKSENFQFVVQFSCDRLNDIIFMTLSFLLDDTDQSNTFEIYQWVYWDKSNNQWQEITTSYNAITHSWEATFEGAVEVFALVKSGDITTLKSVEPGGGQIPGFRAFIIVIGLITCSIILRKRKSNEK